MEFQFKMGSSITPKYGSHSFKPGIVGPFVKMDSSHKMLFLTASHVINRQLVNTGSEVQLNIDGYGNKTCGRVFAGGKGNRAALVEIYDDLVPSRERFKKNIGIHFAGISPVNFPSFDNRNSKNTTQVIVFGRQTRTALVKIVADSKKELLHLYAHETELFKPGEAGSAVFLIDKDRMLHCAGIFAAGNKRDQFLFLLYPIETILKHLTEEVGKTLEIATFDKDERTITTPVKETAIGTSMDFTKWKKCIELNDETYAHYLLENNSLPDQRTLNELSKTFGRTSKIVENVCSRICSHIKDKHKKIITVLPAYRPKNANIIIFVVVLREEIHTRIEGNYSIVMKYIDSETHRYGEEGKYVMYNKLNETTQLSDDEIEILRKCVNKHADDLMKQHKLLAVISGSPIRSKRYGSVNPKLEKEACMVLYVLFKGYIPIDEVPFAPQYNGVPVDVREGMFNPYVISANSYLENLQMGCQIARQKLGTAGAFLEYRGYGLCGLTCAHVLLDSSEMKNLVNNTHGTMEWEIPTSKNSVYQPDNDVAAESRNRREHFVGRLVKAIYRKGGDGDSGMDIALFQVEKRYPISGEFPRLKDGRVAEMRFDSGKCVGVSRLKFGRVKKFGATSDKTEGTVVMATPITSVKHINFESLSDPRFILHNILEVKTLSVSAHFADNGDSGALVFCEGQAGEQLCIGMVEGGFSSGACAVMPIMPILQVLGVQGFKTFENDNIRRELAKLKSEIEELKGKEKQTKDLVNRSFQDFRNNVVDIIDRRIQQQNNN